MKIRPLLCCLAHHFLTRQLTSAAINSLYLPYNDYAYGIVLFIAHLIMCVQLHHLERNIVRK